MTSCQCGIGSVVSYALSAASFLGAGRYMYSGSKPFEIFTSCCNNFTQYVNSTSCEGALNSTVRQLSCQVLRNEYAVDGAISFGLAVAGLVFLALGVYNSCVNIPYQVAPVQRKVTYVPLSEV